MQAYRKDTVYLSDPDLLGRVASDGRVLVSHDLRIMLGHFRSHLAAGKTSELQSV